MTTPDLTPDPTTQRVPYTVCGSLDSQLAAQSAQALRNALSAMRDLANGWPVRELHMAPREIDIEAQDVLVQLDRIVNDSGTMQADGDDVATA